MSVIRLNATREGEVRGPGGEDWQTILAAAIRGVPHGAPVTALIHGYRYTWRLAPAPACACPHERLYRTDPIAPCARRRPHRAAWPERLGFSSGDPSDGLCIAFGWEARPERLSLSSFAAIYDGAAAAGRALARVAGALARLRPDLELDVMAHSLGARVALGAMRVRPELSYGRIIFLGAAEYAGIARQTLECLDRGGGRASFYHVIGRANDLFDALFSLAAPRPPQRGDRVLGVAGLGRDDPDWIDMQLDHPQMAAWLARRGHALSRAGARVSHWHFYADPGAMDFYRAILRERPLHAPAVLRRAGLPPCIEPRWSRLAPVLLPGRAEPEDEIAAPEGLTQI